MKVVSDAIIPLMNLCIPGTRKEEEEESGRDEGG